MKTTKTLAETHTLAGDFIKKLIEIDTKGSVVVGLYGDLGSGKTAFVQGVAKAFNISDQVASPTFVLEKIYKLDEKIQTRFTHLIHIDAYRMDSPEELVHIGWEELLKDSGNLICIEWPEKVATEMPDRHIRIVCGFVDESTHTFDIQKNV